MPKLYQSRFKLIWNLQTGLHNISLTCLMASALIHWCSNFLKYLSYLFHSTGSYNTLDVEDLVEVSAIKQAELIRWRIHSHHLM